ncbi:MAG: class I SAM-dependent methyltransferase, partial [Phycisphaerales bacterium]|nr:class I SAM-dependent methyltransferase [Phycisphaerales bacterium]
GQWMGEHFPNASITAVSNSASQRAYIMEQAEQRGLTNIQVITCDMNDFHTQNVFDRAVSVEMFEHMRNYEVLLSRVASWLKPSGKLFVHVFAHKNSAYPFETEGAGNWMGRHFFTGGIMPAQQLFHEFNRDLVVTDEWTWDGTHYQKTSEAWLQNLDQHKDEVIRLFSTSMSMSEAKRMYHRWRIFFLACAETFGFRQGQEWIIAHYLFEPVKEHSEARSNRVAEPAGAPV